MANKFSVFKKKVINSSIVIWFRHEALEFFGAMIYCLLMCCVVAPIMLFVELCSFLFGYNWIMFPLWSIAFPKFMASGLNEQSSWTTLGGWYTLRKKWLQWEVELLPWYAKKHFIAQCPSDFSKEEIVRYFKCAFDKKAAFENLVKFDREADLFSGDCEMKRFFVRHTEKCLDYEQLLFMLNDGMGSALKAYMLKHTFPESFVRFLMEAGYRSVPELNGREILEKHIRLHGLSAVLIEDLYAGKISYSSALVKDTEKNLAVYGQKKVVRNFEEDCWRRYCRENKVFYPEAEKLMDREKLKIFYNAGHALNEESISYFLSKGDMAVITLIFANEPRDLFKSGVLKSKIDANSEVQKVFYACR